MSLNSYWLRHLRNVPKDPIEKVFEVPFAVFARDPFFRDSAKFNKQGEYSDSEIKVDGKKVEVSLDVHNFTPEQIQVKTVGNKITIEGKKDVKQEDGWTRSHFERKFSLPEGFPPERVECHLDKGKLVLVAFRAQPLEERSIPIQEKSL